VSKRALEDSSKRLQVTSPRRNLAASMGYSAASTYVDGCERVRSREYTQIDRRQVPLGQRAGARRTSTEEQRGRVFLQRFKTVVRWSVDESDLPDGFLLTGVSIGRSAQRSEDVCCFATFVRWDTVSDNERSRPTYHGTERHHVPPGRQRRQWRGSL
jgi:hypothetical protein